MRRLYLPLTALTLALALPAVAFAAPSVKFKAVSVPIKGYPHTGNILGAGAAIHAEYQISGTEYGGYPPPLIGVDFYLSSGTKLHPAGFATCAQSLLERLGPAGCPKASAAGPVGRALGIVSFGGERVEETTTVESFFAPGGGLQFSARGHSPVTLEIPWSGNYVHLGGHAGYGPELLSEVPLVSTVPGAPWVSIESIDVIVGTAHKVHGKTVYYGTVPTRCPKGGFPLKTELSFAKEGDKATPETVSATYKSPCPKA